MAPGTLETVIGQIYSAANSSDWSFAHDHVSALFAPAKVTFWSRQPDPCFGKADPSHRISACVFKDNGVQFFVGIFRQNNEPGFEVSVVDLFRRLVPHLELAIRIHSELTRWELRLRYCFEVLDRFNAAVVLLDSSGRALFCNRRANEIFATGETLTVENGRLQAVNDGQREPFDQAIARVTAFGNKDERQLDTAMLLTGRDGHKPIAALILASRSRSGWVAESSPAAAVFLSDPERDDNQEAILMRLYDLTKAEALTLKALLHGRGLQDAAVQLGISANTAKTHLARILQKTGTGGQTELLRLIFGGPGLIRLD